MPDLSDRLKALGIQIGPQGLQAGKPKSKQPLAAAIGGGPHQTPFGETYLVENLYPQQYYQGKVCIYPQSPFTGLAQWAVDEHLSRLAPEKYAFIDTETTGLSGGAGTYAFLIGAARFENNQFVLRQFFMRDPSEEPAQLAALEQFLAPCEATVTYNGKAFDLPLIHNRFTTHGLDNPIKNYSHVDLLHLSRRLWSDRLPSRTLGNIEVKILGAARTAEDVPGWMVPQLYFDYLRSGDPHPLIGVFYHNLMDVLSLSALLTYSTEVLNQERMEERHRIDILALARLKEDVGDIESAVQLYRRGLSDPGVAQQTADPELILRALLRLAKIYKRAGDYTAAIPLWQQGYQSGSLSACVELAKYYEHIARDYQAALDWTREGMHLIAVNSTPIQERLLKPELEHRQARLERKISSS